MRQLVPISVLWLYILKYKSAYIQHLIKHVLFPRKLFIRGPVDSLRSPETLEVTEMAKTFIKKTKNLTKVKETLSNRAWEKSHVLKK